MRAIVTYVAFIVLFVIALVAVLHFGARLSPAVGIAPARARAGAGGATLQLMLMQTVATLLAAGALGLLSKWLRLPIVVGEIAGGILLGPTFFGYFWPHAYQTIFRPGSLGALKLIADIGVILFMFRVGLEVDMAELRRTMHRAVVISHASIVVPFILGVTLALGYFTNYAPKGTSFLAFSLFLGIAMSITAFPVLARILTERNLSSTPLGRMALTCAAVDDITAWSLLAAVVALVEGGNRGSVWWMIALVLGFCVTMMTVVRRLLSRFEFGERALLLLLFLSALATEAIGIHAVFGAFLAGAIAPVNHETREKLIDRLGIATPALLPLFFAYIGLRTQLTLLTDARSLLALVLVSAVATAGKLGGSAIAGRATGMPWRAALSIGALMNTRGLMELVALDIGYDLGILTPAMFAIMVMMALVTTTAAGPLLALFQLRPAEAPLPAAAEHV